MGFEVAKLRQNTQKHPFPEPTLNNHRASVKGRIWVSFLG
jgi:hypothetical protein